MDEPLSLPEVPFLGWLSSDSGVGVAVVGEADVEASSGSWSPLNGVASGNNSAELGPNSHFSFSVSPHIPASPLPPPELLLQNDRRGPKDIQFYSLWSLFRLSMSHSPTHPLMPTLALLPLPTLPPTSPS